MLRKCIEDIWSQKLLKYLNGKDTVRDDCKVRQNLSFAIVQCIVINNFLNIIKNIIIYLFRGH